MSMRSQLRVVNVNVVEVERCCGCVVGTAVSQSARQSVRQAVSEDRFGDLA